MRKRWKAGDPCPKCDTPLWAESDRYKPGRAVCRPCGLEERRKEQAAARTRTAKPCRVCAAVLTGNDIRQGACKPCRVAAAEAANAARRCPCGASIAHRSKTARFCEKCSVRQKAKGATAGSASAQAKRRQVGKEQRLMATHAVQVPMNTGEYRPPMARAEALAQDRGNDDPARSAWIDSVCARRVGLGG